MGLDPMTELTTKAKEIKDLKNKFQKANEEADKRRTSVDEHRRQIQETEQQLSQIETGLVKYESLLIKKKMTEKALRELTAKHVADVQEWQTELSEALKLSNSISQAEGELHEIKRRVKAEAKQQIRRSLLEEPEKDGE